MEGERKRRGKRFTTGGRGGWGVGGGKAGGSIVVISKFLKMGVFFG